MQVNFQNKIVFLCILSAFLLMGMLPTVPCSAKGLPKDLGVCMAKIYASENGQAGYKQKTPDKNRIKIQRIKMDSANLKLSTERIELSRLQALIQNPTTSAKPDKTLKIERHQNRITIKTEEVQAVDL